MDWEAMAREFDSEAQRQSFDELPKREWYREPHDFEADGVLICGMCGKPKEVVYANGVKFPIIHNHQMDKLFRKEETALEIVERKERNRRQCFAGEFRELERECRLSKADPDTQQEALEAVDKFVKTMYENKSKKMGRGLLIYGHNGRGKTFIAGCLCNELLDKGYKVLMTSTRRLRSLAEERFGNTNNVIDWLIRFDAVCLDDMFQDRATESGREFIITVVDALYKMRVPVIATTNMSAQYLMNPSDQDKPAIDRLKERCERLEMTGRNRRQGRL